MSQCCSANNVILHSNKYIHYIQYISFPCGTSSNIQRCIGEIVEKVENKPSASISPTIPFHTKYLFRNVGFVVPKNSYYKNSFTVIFASTSHKHSLTVAYNICRATSYWHYPCCTVKMDEKADNKWSVIARYSRMIVSFKCVWHFYSRKWPAFARRSIVIYGAKCFPKLYRRQYIPNTNIFIHN